MPPSGGGGRGRGAGRATFFKFPISRRHQAAHFKAPNSRRGRPRSSRRGLSGPGASKGRPQSPPCKESLDKLTPMDWLIQRSLYWPDGTRRKCSEASASENTRTVTGHLLKALVDKYNEDHELSAGCAYELKDALHYQTMREGIIFYSHFNFTAKAKGAGGIDNLFFAEVVEGDEMVVSCFCMIDTDANGCCYGCTNNGSVDMKHPNEANTYNAGYPDAYLLSENTGKWYLSDDDVSDDDEDVKAEEDRLRRIYKGLDDPQFLMKISASPYATATFIED